MEDAHTAVLDLAMDGSDEKISFFGVYDGHGGDRVANFSGENLHKIVAKQGSFSKKEYGQALKDGFLSTDRAILEDGRYKNDLSGCTATTAIINGNKIVCANAGDSRTVLGVKGLAKPLSFDHKPNNEGEQARICAAGGFVEAGRVNGNLALSRAIGDFDFKKTANLPPEEQIVTAYPDVMEHEFTPDDEFVVLACDGIWDCMHSQQVVEFIRRGIAEGQDLVEICENLMDNCLAPESDITGIGCDNMTVLIVALLNGKTKEEWYAMIKDRVNRGDGPVAAVSSVQAKPHHFPQAPQSPTGTLGTISLQQLLGGVGAISGSNGSYIIEAENGASSLFSHFGLRTEEIEGGEENDDDDDDSSESKITPIEDHNELVAVHDTDDEN